MDSAGEVLVMNPVTDRCMAPMAVFHSNISCKDESSSLHCCFEFSAGVDHIEALGG